MQNVNKIRGITYLALAGLMVLFNSGSAMAQGFSFENAVCTILSCFLANGIVLVIATGAILFLGIGAFFGKVSWGAVILTIIAIVAVAGAQEIAELFTGDGCTNLPADACDFGTAGGGAT
jgi:type IV secretory pathway VirB2 component (pilin)